MWAWPTGMFFRTPAGGRAGGVSGLALLLGRLLLAGDLHALGALAGARVGLGVLAAHGQTAAVAQPAVAADLLQPLDVLRALATQVALDRRARCRSSSRSLITSSSVRSRTLRSGSIPTSARSLFDVERPIPVDVGEADFNALVEGMLTPEMRAMLLALSLPLLVTRIRADHKDPALAADDLALLAHRLDRRSYFHARFALVVSDSSDSSAWLWRPLQVAATTPRSYPQRQTPRYERNEHVSRGRWRDRPRPANAPIQAAVGPLPASCQGVRIRGPSAVIAIVNSKCAASEPSWE